MGWNIYEERELQLLAKTKKKEQTTKIFLHQVSWDNNGAERKQTANIESRKTEQPLQRWNYLLRGAVFERPSCYFQ